MPPRHGLGPLSLLAGVFRWETETKDRFANWYYSLLEAPDLATVLRHGYDAKNEQEQREIDVLLRWYGVGSEGESLSKIGESYKVTGSMISQIKNRANRRLHIREKRSNRVKEALRLLGFDTTT
jgi:hypothetical protein